MTAVRRTVAAALAASAVLLSACTSDSGGSSYTFHGAQAAPGVIGVADRKPVDDFSGGLLNGGTYDLTQDDDKVTVVNFWGAWCPPCQIETPQFNTIYQQYKGKGVAFVGIDFKEASRGLPRAFVAQHKISYPIVYDQDGEIAVRVGNIPTQAAPFTMILDKQHRVAGVYIGRMAPSDIEPVLNKLVAEK